MPANRAGSRGLGHHAGGNRHGEAIGGLESKGGCGAAGAARGRQDHPCSPGAGRCRLARPAAHPDAGAEASGGTYGRAAHGGSARRACRQDGGLCGASGTAGRRLDPHRSGHGRGAHRQASAGSGPGRCGVGHLRRVPRTPPRIGSGTGPVPRDSAGTEPGSAPAGDERHPGRRTGGRPAGQCPGDPGRRAPFQRGNVLSADGPSPPPRRVGGPGRGPRGAGGRGEYPRVFTRGRRDPAHRGLARSLRAGV